MIARVAGCHCSSAFHRDSSHCQGRFPTDLGETLSTVTGASRIARVEAVNILDQQATSAQPLSEKESGKIGDAATEQCCAAGLISPDKTGQHDHATLQFSLNALDIGA